MTVKLEITNIVKTHQKLYPAMLFALSQIINQHEEFRTAFDGNGNLGIFDVMHPCYTVFHPSTETFSNLWTPYTADYGAFSAAYEADKAQYGNVTTINPNPGQPENTFSVSMIPWESFEGFNLNLQKGYDYLTPIFTLGRYTVDNGRYHIPLAIQVHHAVCDGFHVCRFIRELRELLAQPRLFCAEGVSSRPGT